MYSPTFLCSLCVSAVKRMAFAFAHSAAASRKAAIMTTPKMQRRN